MNPTTANLSGDARVVDSATAREDAGNAPPSSPRTERTALLFWLLPGSILLVIVAISLAPKWDPDLPKRFENLPHAVAYALLMVSLLAVTQRRFALRPWVRAATTAGLALLVVSVGALLELGQRVVHRDVEAVDVAANAAGVAAALVGWLFVQAVRALRRTR